MWVTGFLIAFLVDGSPRGAEAFSANPLESGISERPPRKQFIQINNLLSPQAVPQQLPVSIVENWSTWVLDRSGVWSKIPDSDGFVPPTSVDTLFQPIDIKAPQFQLALGFHVREGSIRQILPALDICFEGGQHRNRGLCSVPRAYKWIEFADGMFGEWKNFSLRALKRRTIQGSEEDNSFGEWEVVAAGPSGEAIAIAIERTILSMAQSAPVDLGEGSHLVHVLLDYDEDRDALGFEYPQTGHELCVIMDDRSEMELLIDDSLQDEAQGILHVTTSATMAGSESQYLPEVYKPLFHDKSLRNPVYEKFRQRREQQK